MHNTKKRQKKRRNPDATAEPQTCTVKCGLRSILCPLYERRNELLGAIKEDALIYSRFQIQYAYRVYDFYNHYLTRFVDDAEEFYRLFPTNSFSVLLGLCKARTPAEFEKKNSPIPKIPDSDSRLASFFASGIVVPDSWLRTSSLQYIRSKYETNFQTNLKEHAFRRLKRVVRHIIAPHVCLKDVHDQIFKTFYKNEQTPLYEQLLARIPSLPRNERELNVNPWKFVHGFYVAQTLLADVPNARSFRLFPVASVKRKHVVYDFRALHELGRRVDRDATPGLYKTFAAGDESLRASKWNRFFDFGRLETSVRKFGGHLETNGIVASVTVNKPTTAELSLLATTIPRKRIRKTTTPSTSSEACHVDRRRYDRVVAIDPGARLPLACYEKTAAGEDKFSKITAKEYYVGTGEKRRKRFRIKNTAALERDYRTTLETTAEMARPVFTDGRRYATTIPFCYDWFERRWTVYGCNDKLVRNETFDAYILKDVAKEKITRKLFPEMRLGENPTTTLIMYGSGSNFMNTSHFRLRGCAKFSHNSLLKKLKYKRNLRVELVGESYTSKMCSHCFEVTGTQERVVFPSSRHSRHRYVFCPKCRNGGRGGMHRDANAAKNIYLKNVGKFVSNHPSAVSLG